MLINMDLNSRAYFKFHSLRLSEENFDGEYRRISNAIGLLAKRHNHKIPEALPLEEMITGDTISNKYARRKEIFQSIDTREFIIWQHKQYIIVEYLL
ncbi:hypothetical protein GLOIN_2v1873913 [Rhizophagus clarus]|uniref:Uncharacterized protein n=1 Tax=Rhizophagus clarus TaxID=94130 RepID=A0A8H3MCZ5_9GLOM|nr:hypothetical protein GLOIN_2v1873913 [Rhizophagus clarus]